MGTTPIHQPKEWLIDHFNDNAARSETSAGPAALNPTQINALLHFVTDLKPDDVDVTAISPHFISGAQIFVSSACASCHKVNGEGGTIGPALNGLAHRHSQVWVKEHFASPRKLSPGSLMPPYHFGQRDQQDLIDYLFSLPE